MLKAVSQLQERPSVGGFFKLVKRLVELRGLDQLSRS